MSIRRAQDERIEGTPDGLNAVTEISDVPDAPTIGTATAGAVDSGQVSITYTAAITGGTATTFTATSTPGSLTGTGTSPITVSGLTGGTAYTFKVKGTNSTATGPESAASNAATPPAFVFPAQGALFSAGYNSSGVSDVISYVDITTAGNSVSFGTLTLTPGAYFGGTACASSTRGIHIQGYTSNAARYNGIQYSTFATKGNAINFGNSIDWKSWAATCSNSTRGVTMNGTNATVPPPNNYGGVVYTIDYITIASAGNATSFGTSTYPTDGLGGCASSTRGLFGGRTTAVYGRSIDIEYITIATTGTPANFGNLNAAMSYTSSASSSTRGFFAGSAGNHVNIDYVTIASTGNATNFGNLTVGRGYAASVAGTTRGLTAGGYATSANSFVIDYITIASAGNATSFGNLLSSGGAQGISAMSNSHGGL